MNGDRVSLLQLLEQQGIESALRQELAALKLQMRRYELRFDYPLRQHDSSRFARALRTQTLERDVSMKTKSCDKEKERTRMVWPNRKHVSRTSIVCPSTIPCLNPNRTLPRPRINSRERFKLITIKSTCTESCRDIGHAFVLVVYCIPVLVLIILSVLATIILPRREIISLTAEFDALQEHIDVLQVSSH